MKDFADFLDSLNGKTDAPIVPVNQDSTPKTEPLPDWIAGVEMSQSGQTDRWFESLPTVRNQFAKFEKIRRLFDNGFPPIRSPKPPAAILAAVVPICCRCHVGRVIKGQPGRPQDLCYACYVQLAVASCNDFQYDEERADDERQPAADSNQRPLKRKD